MPLDAMNFAQHQQQDMVLDLLRRTRERVAQPDGWCQDAYVDGSRVCLGQALSMNFVQGLIRTPMFSAAYDEAAGIIKSLIKPWRSIECYNDEPGRTQTEVVELLDRAIAVIGGE